MYVLAVYMSLIRCHLGVNTCSGGVAWGGGSRVGREDNCPPIPPPPNGSKNRDAKIQRGR